MGSYINITWNFSGQNFAAFLPPNWHLQPNGMTSETHSGTEDVPYEQRYQGTAGIILFGLPVSLEKSRRVYSPLKLLISILIDFAHIGEPETRE